MTGKWPTLSGRYSRTVTMIHAQAWAGNPEPHPHELLLTFCWKHEINPHHGHTWPLSETQRHVNRLCALVDGKFFNELIGDKYHPTAENLACWLLVRVPAFYDRLEIDCYERIENERRESYSIGVDRKDIPKHWVDTYMGGQPVTSLTA